MRRVPRHRRRYPGRVSTFTDKESQSRHPQCVRLCEPSYSFCSDLVRHSAIRIVCDRFLSSASNVTNLTRDMYSSNPDRRLEATDTLKLLERFASPDSFVAVSFLERLRDSATQSRSSWDAEIEGWPRLQDLPTPIQYQHLSRLRSGREESSEEQALRRRRREAVVVNEGDHPLTQQDIIQRNPSHTIAGPTREMENRRVERALEAISAEERAVYIDEDGAPAELVRTHGEGQPGS